MKCLLIVLLICCIHYSSCQAKYNIKVSTFNSPPLIYINKNLYSGFLVDLFTSVIAQINTNPAYNVTYSFSTTKDPQAGYYNKNLQKYNGLLNDVISNGYDLALYTIPITSDLLDNFKLSYSFYEYCKFYFLL
jgi:hypothetical protein